MNDRKCSRNWLLLVLTCTAGLGGRPAAAQIDQPGGDVEQVTSIFPPAPRALRQQLARARKALEEQRYDEAVDRLGQLLASPQAGVDKAEQAAEQDYFLGDSSEPGTQVSLKSEAQRLLGAMPPKGRELYELKFGADARQWLESAMERQDVEKLVEVTRRYFHTNAGYEATMLLGRYHLDQGQPLAAALRFQLLLTSPHATAAYDPELSVLLATCWLLADMPDRAREALAGIKQRSPDAVIRVGGQRVAIFADERESLGWLANLMGAGFVANSVGATEWTMFRGAASRNAESAAGLPLLTPRWLVRTANHPTDESLIRQQRQVFVDQGIPTLPGLHPLAVSDMVLMRTPRRLIAVDLETGKRTWDFPWMEAPDEESLHQDRVRPLRHDQDPRVIELQQRVWDDAPYGQMSSDGRYVFLLWGLTANTGQSPVIVQPGGRIGPNTRDASRINKLVALDLKAEGKLRWIVGDEDGTDEPQLAGAFFLGAPLPLMGQLYVLAEQAGQIRLVVLDIDTGALQWSQQLAHVEMRDISVDSLRRAAGASPSFSNGVLVCPTSAGAVVGVDVSTRSLLWGYQYPTAREVSPFGFNEYARLPLQPVGNRWADATVTIADGRVLATPVESDKLYCLDLITGQPVWDAKPRNGTLYVGCVSEGRAVLIGSRQIQAISLADGSTIWTLDLPGGMPSGRGMVAGKQYFLPTTARQLLAIDLPSGKIVKQAGTDLVLGNLVAYKDQIVSQHVDWLSAFYQIEPLRVAVAGRLKENPEDLWALARQAELLLADGNYSGAVSAFRHALRLEPEDDGIRASLISSLLHALRDDFPRNRDVAVELQELVDQPAQKAEFYRLMSIGLHREGDFANALDFCIKLATLDPYADEEGGTLAADLVAVDQNLRVRRDRWIQMHFEQMLAAAQGAAREHMDKTIQTLFDESRGGASIRQWSRFVNHFGAHPLGNRARLELARLLIDSASALEAEQQLVDLQQRGDPELAAQATALLARLLQGNQKIPDAAICFRQLADQYRDVIALDGQTGEQVAAAARSDETLRQALDDPPSWPRGKCVVAEQARGTFSNLQRIAPVNLVEVTGPFPHDHWLEYDQQQYSVILRNGYGEVQQLVMLGDQNRFRLSNIPAGSASVRGHLIVLNVGFEVLAIDTLRNTTSQGDTVLWRHDLSGSLPGTDVIIRQLTAQTIERPWGPARYIPSDGRRSPLGRVGPITRHGVVYQKAQELMCVDALTGTPIWSRAGLPAGSEVFGDDEYLFVIPPEEEEALVLKACDGSHVGRRTIARPVERWVSSGRCMLLCQLTGGALELRWFDAWEQKDIWRRTVDARTQCWLPGRDELAWLEPSGKFAVVRLADGAPCVETQLEPEPDLARLYVLRSNDRYMVAACGKPSVDPSVSRYNAFSFLGGDQCPQVDGRIYSIDRRAGTPHWPHPATVRQFGLPLDQPPESPVLMLLQHQASRTAPDSPRVAIKASLLCLDKRDGRQLLLDQELGMLRNYEMAAQPANATVSIKTNSKSFLLTFTDEAVPAAAPFRMEEPKEDRESPNQVGKIAEAILKAITTPPTDTSADEAAAKEDAKNETPLEPAPQPAEHEKTPPPAGNADPTKK